VWCQGLFLGKSEDGILARLAQARDGKFFEGQGISECGLEHITVAGYTGAELDAAHAINAEYLFEHLIETGILGRSFEGLFHVCSISYFGGGFKRGVGFISHL